MKSYFTFLSRNKLYTAIQFFGLAIALWTVVLLTSMPEPSLHWKQATVIPTTVCPRLRRRTGYDGRYCFGIFPLHS